MLPSSIISLLGLHTVISVMGYKCGFKSAINIISCFCALQLISKDKYEKYHLIVQFMIQYMTTVTIALLNAMLPVLFKIVVKAEDYSPALEVNITLAR